MILCPSESEDYATPVCSINKYVLSHELYIYANTFDMYANFAPKLNGRYLSSNVNITVFDKHGAKVSVPVGGEPCNVRLELKLT
jgi:hypothetical protein